MFKHPADNHHESQRRRPDLPSLGPPASSKTASKQMTVNAPTKTNSSGTTTGPALPAPSATTPGPTLPTKGSSILGQPTIASLTEDPGDSNAKSGESTSLKPPQASSVPPHTLGKSAIPNGKNEATSNVLSSATRDIPTLYDGIQIPNIDDSQVMLPPKRSDKDASESVTGDYEPRLDDVLWSGVDVTENVHKRKGTDVDLPTRKSAKLTAMVSLNCGTSDEAAKVLITIAKNGLDTRFEITQEGSEF